MLDIHTHILPGMDDGAKNAEEALALLNMLKLQGIKTVVLTPHFYSNRESLDSFLERRGAAFRLIPKCDMELIQASETYLSEVLLSYDNIAALCIGDTKYLLLELPFGKSWGTGVFKQIDQLIAKFNILPIIAHAERYEAVKKNKIKIFNELVDIGCLLQFNTASVVNRKTRSATLKLIKAGWVDFIGSDCHDVVKRAPQFDEFNKIIMRKVGLSFFEKLKVI